MTAVRSGRPWVVLQHADHGTPGALASSLTEAGWTVRTVRCDLGDALPDPGGAAGLVVLGGPMGVHDNDAHPWLVEERSVITAAVGEGRPVVGVALGAEQLAMALGAEVLPGSPESGIGEVVLTADGRRDPVLGPEYGGLAATAVPCLHWHRDAFSLPQGARHLAASRATPHQAFRYGERAYGFQFHIEVDAELARSWFGLLPAGGGVFDGGPPGGSMARVGSLDSTGLSRIETVNRRLARRLVAAVTR